MSTTTPIWLRPTTVADLDFVIGAEHAPENAVWVMPWTREQHGAALSDADLLHRTIEDERGVLCGFALVAGVASPHGNLEFRRIVVTDKGRGIGRLAVRELLRLAFDDLHAHRLWLDVKDQNARARALYAQEGFVEEGRLRECLRTATGAYETLVVMAMLEGEYRARRATG